MQVTRICSFFCCSFEQQPEKASSFQIPSTHVVCADLSKREIKQLSWDEWIVSKVPGFEFQNKIDALGREIESKFKPLFDFNDWLNANTDGSWYKQLALFLVKLPLKAARNIISLLYNVIKSILNTAVHPVQSLVGLVKMVIALVKALARPETWSKIGAGIMGASAGQALAMGNPVSLIALGIGGALLVGGLSVSTFLAALREESVGEHLLNQAQELSEAALTGFLVGLLLGGVQRFVSDCQTRVYLEKTRHFKSFEEAERYADVFAKYYDLPPPSDVIWHSWPNSDQMTIQWTDATSIQQITQSHAILNWDKWVPSEANLSFSLGDRVLTMAYDSPTDFDWTYFAIKGKDFVSPGF